MYLILINIKLIYSLLWFIFQGYLKKMRKKNSPFSKQDVKELFMNIEEIYEFNK